MAFVEEWIKRSEERVLTADQVKRLDLGTRVTVISADRHGECQRQEWTVAQSGLKKILITRDSATWERLVMPIRDNPNKRFVIQRGGQGS